MFAYTSRAIAGTELARALRHHARTGALVLAIPRGGVLVAAQITRPLLAQLDVLIVRETPFAVCVEGHRPVVDLERVIALGLHATDVSDRLHEELANIALHQALFRADAPFPRVAGRTVIVVDGGSSTTHMLSAAVRALRSDGAHRLVLAAPTMHPDAHATLDLHYDEIVTAVDPRRADFAIRDFDRVSDDDVLVQLRHVQCNVDRA